MILVMLFWCDVVVAGPLLYEDYRKLKDDPGLDVYIEGLLSGVTWTNAEASRLNSENKKFQK